MAYFLSVGTNFLCYLPGRSALTLWQFIKYLLFQVGLCGSGHFPFNSRQTGI